MTYPEAVDFLYSLQFFGIKLGLDNTRDFLHKVGCEHPKQKIVHIAGTNGKGSTSAVVAKVAEEHGFKVGLYTSPHILDFRERIRINGEMVSEEFVLSFTKEYQNYILDKKLTFFEVTTVMAITFFISENVDLLVLETGMGGRLDATNCFKPSVTIITNVSMDHESFLGNTLEKIVKEKAGIIKPKVPLICASQDNFVLDQIETICHGLEAPFKHIDIQTISDNSFEYNGKKYSSPLLGKHQQLNGKTALEACSCVFELDEKNVEKALKSIRWRGRLEQWEKYPNVYLDVSHNVHGVKETVSTLKNIDFMQKYVIVFAFLDDKDTKSNLSILKEIADSFYSYKFENKRLKNVQIFPNEIEVKEYNESSFEHFVEKNKNKKILVIGSHYLIEDILKQDLE